ncbi:MAG: hypothetical protein AAGB31_16260 [Bdellovibrio sp.]
MKYLLVLLLPVMAWAQNQSSPKAVKVAPPASIANIEESLQSLKEQNSQLSRSLVGLTSKVTEAEKATAAAQKEFDSVDAEYTEAVGSAFSLRRGKNAPLEEKLKAANQKLDAAKAEEKNIRGQAQSVSSTQKKLIATISRQEQSQQKANEVLVTALNSSNVLDDFSRLQRSIGDTDLTLEKISNSYDKTLLGAYLKDKMGLLLNSNLMCEGYNRCKVPEPKKIPNENIEKTLFPDTSNSTRKQNYYDKAYGTQ